MRRSVFGKWVLSTPLKAYVFMPGFITLGLIALYYSNMLFLQNLVAPGTEGARTFSFWGFGLLEIVQKMVLLCVYFFLIRGLMVTREWPARIIIMLMMFALGFVLVQDTQFGAGLVHSIAGQGQPPAQAAWNSGVIDGNLAAGEQVAGYLKTVASVFVLAVFALAALLGGNSRNRTARLLAPSRWILATVGLTILMARLASFLEGAGLGAIRGHPGALTYNSSEFAELCVYFLFLLYAAALHERIIARQ